MKKILISVAFAMFSAIGYAQAVGTATLTWQGTASEITNGTTTGFNIYRANVACPGGGTVPGGMVVIKSVAATVLTYTDTPLSTGSYCYQVTATGPGGESVASNTAGKSIFGVPSAPGALIVK